MLEPAIVVADEPIAALDMSVRAKILSLMAELRAEMGLSFVYITHDLASARFFCDRIAIMYLGRIVEVGPVEEIFTNPRHPYTKALLAAVPSLHQTMQVEEPLRGEVPDAANRPRGCAFHPRCPVARPECGWEARDLGSVLERRWAHTSETVYERESAIVGDVLKKSKRDESAVYLAAPRSVSPARMEATLADIRTATVDESLWAGSAK